MSEGADRQGRLLPSMGAGASILGWRGAPVGALESGR